MHSRRVAFRKLLPLIACMAWSAMPAGLAAIAHPGPSIWGDIKFADGRMIYTIEGAADPLTTNLGCSRLLLGPLPEPTVAQLRDEILRYFQEHNAVAIDGQRVLPELKGLTIQDGTQDEASWKSARIELTYPCPAAPRQIATRWDSFTGEGIDFIPVVINVPDATPMMFSMFRDEPEHIWHAENVRPRHAAEFTAMKLESRGKVEVSLPAAALALLALAAAIGFALCGRRRTAVITALSLLAGAFLLRGEGRTEVPVPWQTRVHLPAREQALALFKALHGNIYAAFEASSEDRIYELLATSVDPAILDDLYADVYESLILREQGGAICAIEGVDVLEGSIDDATYASTGEPVFVVHYQWQVHGVVSHWGHIHRRMNEYDADYTVRHDGQSWKIAAVNVKNHRRVEDFE